MKRQPELCPKGCGNLRGYATERWCEVCEWRGEWYEVEKVRAYYALEKFKDLMTVVKNQGLYHSCAMEGWVPDHNPDGSFKKSEECCPECIANTEKKIDDLLYK